MLKSRGCDAMTGAGGSLSGRSSESRERNGLGRSDPDRCTSVGKTGRNNRMATDERCWPLQGCQAGRLLAVRTGVSPVGGDERLITA